VTYPQWFWFCLSLFFTFLVVSAAVSKHEDSL